jgi:uncharacterized sulfatase
MHKPHLDRRSFLKVIGAGALVAGLPGCASRSLTGAGDTPPNVLFLSLDDLNCALGCYGNPQVQSPNIDALAKRGTRFSYTYAQYAACLPSRVSFLSGWYPDRTEVYTFKPQPRDGKMHDAVYLGQHFRDNGYFTAGLDKVFHIGHNDAQSWDVFETPVKNEEGENKTVWTPHELKAQGLEAKVLRQGRYEHCSGEKGVYAAVDVADDELMDGINATRAVEILEARARDTQPFFLGVGFRRPHLPWILPPRYFDMYPPESIDVPWRPENADPDIWSTRAEQQAHIACYYAAVSFIDRQVGRVLGALDRTGLADTTIVVLFGDQGYCLGERNNHFGKGNMYEWSLVVPLIISAPGMPRGKSTEHVVELLDMYPTLVDLCGLPQPAHGLQGRSLTTLLRNPDAQWQDHAFSVSGNPSKGVRRSVRTAEYRYVEQPNDQPPELYRYAVDPWERNNLAGQSDYARIQAQLADLLAQDRS